VLTPLSSPQIVLGAQQQPADEWRPPHCRSSPPLRREGELPAPVAGSADARTAGRLLFARDGPALLHASSRSGASTYGRIYVSTQRRRCECAASARCSRREAAKVSRSQPASSDMRADGGHCVLNWAQALLTLSGAVRRSRAQPSVGFLSTLRKSDARSILSAAAFGAVASWRGRARAIDRLAAITILQLRAARHAGVCMHA
jgi:hypothetical protein